MKKIESAFGKRLLRTWKPSRRGAVLLVVLAALVAGMACSKDTPAATSKPPVTLDPDVFEAENPELFKTAKAEPCRPMSTELSTRLP